MYLYDYNDKSLIVEGISNTDHIENGAYVYTSGLGGVFPRGILVGTVSSITTDEYDLSKIIKVKPSADFEDINYVNHASIHEFNNEQSKCTVLLNNTEYHAYNIKRKDILYIDFEDLYKNLEKFINE